MSSNKSAKWIIGIVLTLVVVTIGSVVYYEKTSPKVFTKTEYVREVIFQNKEFEKVLDNFLDQVFSYDGTKASTEKLNNTAAKFPEFVEGLETKLEPRVPHESQDHFDQMIEAYKVYLDAIEMYRKAVLKNDIEERNILMSEAKTKLEEAKNTMKNIK